LEEKEFLDLITESLEAIKEEWNFSENLLWDDELIIRFRRSMFSKLFEIYSRWSQSGDSLPEITPIGKFGDYISIKFHKGEN